MKTLGKEIGLTLVLKLSLLVGLWYVCFSKPVRPHIKTPELAERLLNTPKTIPSLTQTLKQKKVMTDDSSR